MMDKVEIMQASNGFILSQSNCHTVYTSLDELFNALLLHYEGLSPLFHGDRFGAVIINREINYAGLP